MIDWLPRDLWAIVLRFKKDMELLQTNINATNSFLSKDLTPCSTKYTLETFIDGIFEFPFHILFDYLEARAVYRKRLAVWGIPDDTPNIDMTFPMIL